MDILEHKRRERNMIIYNLLVWLEWLRQQPPVAATWPLWPAALLALAVPAGYALDDWRRR